MKCSRLYLLVVLLSILFPSKNILGQEDLPNGLKDFEEFAENVRKDWNVPGSAVAVVKGNKIVYAKGFGYRDLEKKLPVTENTLFAIGSTTKAMTATMVGTLVDDGLLEWDKPVVNYLSDFRMYEDHVTKEITVRDMMCHRSGLPRHDMAWYGSERSREELVHAIRYLEPTKSFRSTWQYQNLMFMTAGYLSGEVAGKSWEALMREKLFDPLDMKRSNFSVATSQKDGDFSYPYAEVEDKITKIPFRQIDAVGPAGSVNSSVKEMANWLMMNIQGGTFNGEKVVSASSLQQVHFPQMVMPGNYDENFFYKNYGLGWVITSYKDHPLITHGGGIDGFITQVAVLPKDSIGIVVLTNSSTGGSPMADVLLFSLFDRMLDLERTDWHGKKLEAIAKMEEANNKKEEKKDEERITGTVPSHELKAYTGTYKNPGYGTLDILLVGDSLRLNYHSFDVPIHHYHYDVFQTDDPLIGKRKFVFYTDVEGNIEKIASKLEPALDHEIVFERVPEVSKDLAALLEASVGEYELNGVTITVKKKEEGTLDLHVPGQPNYTLVPSKGNEFKIEGLSGYKVIFKQIEGSDQVHEMILDQPNGVFTTKRKN